MAIEKMRLINITSDMENIDDVLRCFMTLDNFHVEPASKFLTAYEGAKTFDDANPYEESIALMKETAATAGFQLEEIECDIDAIDIEATQQKIQEFREEYLQAKGIYDEIKQVIDENQLALTQLENLRGLGVGIDELLSCRYLKVRLGKLPIDNVKKLEFYSNKPFLFQSFNRDNTYSWCMYMTTPRYCAEVDNIFSSLYFEPIALPSFVHSEPSKAIENLESELEADMVHLQNVDDYIHKLVNAYKEVLGQSYSILLKKSQLYAARKVAIQLGDKFMITGFVPKNEVEQVKEAFLPVENVVEIDVRPAHSDARLQPPTKLKNGWFSKPFSYFVQMYGLPDYDEKDPTFFVALSYTLLFGIMFGDLGQGIVLYLFCVILDKKKGYALCPIGKRLGISSAFFGFLYGSFFGNEEILTPIFTNVFHMEDKPIDVMDNSFTMTLLIIAIGIGCFLIICCMVINTFKHFKNANLGEALFSQNGLAGLIFYASVIIAAFTMYLGLSIVNVVYVVVLIVIPVLAMFLKEPISRKMKGEPLFPDGFGGFFMESFFELFEVMLTYISNTMSFLRVGGFVLSHAGMMLVVMTLAEMVPSAFYFLVVIGGNLFVMVLEGLIVGIQVLRLEFDEMFSRYFEGKGVPYTPIKFS